MQGVLKVEIPCWKGLIGVQALNLNHLEVALALQVIHCYLALLHKLPNLLLKLFLLIVFALLPNVLELASHKFSGYLSMHI